MQWMVVRIYIYALLSRKQEFEVLCQLLCAGTVCRDEEFEILFVRVYHSLMPLYCLVLLHAMMSVCALVGTQEGIPNTKQKRAYRKTCGGSNIIRKLSAYFEVYACWFQSFFSCLRLYQVRTCAFCLVLYFPIFPPTPPISIGDRPAAAFHTLQKAGIFAGSYTAPTPFPD